MKIIVDGLAVEYKDEGSGQALLMLHGWGNTMRYFDELANELNGFRIVRLDLPGFGESELPPAVWTVESYARFVAHFCEKVGITPIVIIGHSLGGRIATKGVGNAILAPQKLVLIASAGVAERRSFHNILYAAIAKVGKVVLLPFPKSWYERTRSSLYTWTGSDYLTVGGMSETFLNMIREDLSVDAAKITIPTLLIWGKNDAVTLVSEAEKLHQLIKNSKLLIVSSAGHFVHREKSAEVAQAIKDFV